MSLVGHVNPHSAPEREREPAAPPAPRVVSAAEGYECWAPSYDHLPNPLLAREERHMLPLLTGLRKKQALDLACGTGRWLETCMAQGCESGVGVDCSLAMLQVAAAKFSLGGRLARADCQNLPLPNATFDLVICSFALGHIRDLAATASELERVTRPGADIFVTDLHPDAYVRGWRVGFRSGGTAIQVETQSRSANEIVHTFCAASFTCQVYESLWLEDPEKPLFARAGRSHKFEEACSLPAVLVCHFRRIDSRQSASPRWAKVRK